MWSALLSLAALVGAIRSIDRSNSWSYALVLVLAYALNPITAFASAPRALENGVLLVALLAATCGATAATVLSLILLLAWVPVAGVCIAAPLLLTLAAARRTRAGTSLDLASAVLSLGHSCSASHSALCVLDTHRYWDQLQTRLAPQQVDATLLTPQLSLSWYLLHAAFLRYMPFFVVLVWLHPLGYVAPVMLRFRRAPTVAFTLLLSLACLFDPSNGFSLARLPLCACLMLAHRQVIEGMRNCTLWLGLLAFCLAVSPVMQYLWMQAGSGNANFMFNQQIILAISAGSITAEFAAAALRVDKQQRRATSKQQQPLAA